jgi:hypothetical protein
VTDPREEADNEHRTELRDSSPNAGRPERAAGGMGVSSERVGPTGGGEGRTDGEKDTSAPAETDQSEDVVGTDAAPERGEVENPTGVEPKAGYPSLDPRRKDAPYKDA